MGRATIVRGLCGAAVCLRLVVLAVAVAALAACQGSDSRHVVTVSAEIVEADAPARVEATGFSETSTGLLAHEVRVVWSGEQTVVLSDARFTHDITSGDGSLVIDGRGCGTRWDDSADSIVQACTADLQVIRVEPGRDHAYPVTVYPTVGPRRLAAGTYVVEETLTWWEAPAGEFDPLPANPAGTFTIRLTYTVT